MAVRIRSLTRLLPYFTLVHSLALLTVLLASGTLSAQTAGEIFKKSPSELVDLLGNDTVSAFDKAKACQRLAVVGDASAVPALQKLLGSLELNLYARTALEQIADPAADTALREAAGELEGRALVGVIDSIAKRRDEQAVELLASRLSDNQLEISIAAARALAEIGSDAAGQELQRAFRSGVSPRVYQLAEAYLRYAERIAPRDQGASLAAYREIADAYLPSYLHAAALQGQFLLLGDEGADLLVKLVGSGNDEEFNVALLASRSIATPGLTARLVELMPELTVTRQARLLAALGDRGEQPPVQRVVDATRSESPELREAAVRVLASMNAPEALQTLVDLVAQAAPGTQAPAAAPADVSSLVPLAVQALRDRPGSSTDAAILQRLLQLELPGRVRLLELVGARRIAEAEPLIVATLEGQDQSARQAALQSWAQVIQPKDLGRLVQFALQEQAGPEGPARQALLAASLRLPDREATARQLAEIAQKADASHRVTLLEVLTKMGGGVALETLRGATTDQAEPVRDAAVRLLGEWPSPDAAGPLLEIARGNGDSRFQIRALRGYLRIARQLQLSPEERLQMFKTALEVARREEEQTLAFSVLERVPSPDSLELALSQLDKPALQASAGQTALKIAPKILRSHPQQVVAGMERLLKSSPEAAVAEKAKQLRDQAAAAQ
jgi:HEAT repeat protein